MITIGMLTCEIRTISLQLGTERAVAPEVLLMMEKLLRFDLLIGINIIKALGGVSLSKSGRYNFLVSQFLPMQWHQHSSSRNLISKQSLISNEMNRLHNRSGKKAESLAKCKTLSQNILCQQKSE